MEDLTLDEFLRRYGRPSGECPTFEVGSTIDGWPMIVVRFGDKTAVLQLCGVGADSHAHLSIDVHAFVGDQLARAAVYGMENGVRYTNFDDTTPGTSHGWPAVQGVTVIVGAQTERTTD